MSASSWAKSHNTNQESTATIRSGLEGVFATCKTGAIRTVPSMSYAEQLKTYSNCKRACYGVRRNWAQHQQLSPLKALIHARCMPGRGAE
eukprot:2156413-Amphidinium_carterae.1